ncbi:CoA-binding protein [Caldalkalibacillus mannanilyticus]|uniref:CoA-binding protein n=1 Tax=Caldalkalibacillus mannanilyticus TaxID=1418 RepID=UPI0004696B1C|nr:CoA-binding protein [Caldalkalibacillus mannanilyticus]
MSYQQPAPEQIAEILKQNKRIAVVGISDKPDRASFQVAQYMQRAGYEIIPINPRLDEVLGVKAYRSLDEVEGTIDIVNVFRRSEETPPVAKEAAKVGAKILWLQLGIHSDEAYEIAKQGGMEVVMDRCIKIDHAGLR